MPTEAQIERRVDALIEKFTSGPIKYYLYMPGVPDLYEQRQKIFSAPVTLVGRAIHNPTPEQISVIGNDEVYDIAFLFSRLQLIAKFPSAAEGDWLDTSGQLEWRNRRYKIEKVAPSGQVGVHFSLCIVLATSILGDRDP